MVDLIVPTIKGREDSLSRCLASYKANTAEGILNVIIVHDEPTVGHAWEKGMGLSTAPYVALGGDDLEVTSSTWAGVCCETVDEGLLPCPVIWRPDGNLESCGGDMNSPACLITEMQADRTPTNFTVLPFMSREQADAIGMIPIHYGSDTWVSLRGRQLGYETVVRHGYELRHHQSQVGRLAAHPGEMQVLEQALAA